MGAGGKKTVSVGTAVFNAVRHAYGAVKGFKNTFSGIWDTFKQVYDTIKDVYDKVVKWVKEELKPLWEVYSKLKNYYDKYVKPYLDWVCNKVKWLEASYLAFRGKVYKALKTLDERAFKWIREAHYKVDKILRGAQDFASIFSDNIAEQINRLRDQIRTSIIEPINKLESWIYDLFFALQVWVIKRFDAFLAWARLKTMRDRDVVASIFKDLDRVLYPDGKPKFSHAFKTNRFWGEALIEHIASQRAKPYIAPKELIGKIVTAKPGGTENPVVSYLEENYPNTPSMIYAARSAAHFEKKDWGRFRKTLAKLEERMSDEEISRLGLSKVDARREWEELERKYRITQDKLVDRSRIYALPNLLREYAYRRQVPNPVTPPQITVENLPPPESLAEEISDWLKGEQVESQQLLTQAQDVWKQLAEEFSFVDEEMAKQWTEQYLEGLKEE